MIAIGVPAGGGKESIEHSKQEVIIGTMTLALVRFIKSKEIQHNNY
jgi:hypothetical protein